MVHAQEQRHLALRILHLHLRLLCRPRVIAEKLERHLLVRLHIRPELHLALLPLSERAPDEVLSHSCVLRHCCLCVCVCVCECVSVFYYCYYPSSSSSSSSS